jgi:Asp-tRNA(Asn)/Glu-tRNA(Gln) amidotransferase A subunit family amidase
VFDDNATVVRKLEEAGAVLCAKLSMGALAMNDVWFKGTTKNPWNPKQGSSGSSAGSGAAVAAGLVAFAIGTETLGSICSPSERCRVTGLRPTYGRISRAGGMALSYTMDKVGPMVRSAEDAALVLGELCGEDSADPSAVSRSFEWPAKMDWKKLKIGFLRWPDAPTEPEKAIESNVHLGRLQKFGATVVPVQFSPVSPIMQSILLVESSSAFDAFTRGDQVDSLKNSMWPQIFRAARYVPAVEYLQMQRARQLLMKQFEDEWGDLDLVIGPSIAASILLTTNLTGHPQIVLPQGDDGKGNSRSLSLIGRLFEEDKLLAVAIALQEADDFHRRRPNLNVF